MRICLDCGKTGPWVNHGHGLFCGPCRARRDKSRKDAYSYRRHGIPPVSGRCSVCGSRERLTWDHVIPISKGGKTVMSNLSVLCLPCNSRKGNR